MHATALDCYGVGVLIAGAPGIGKSETALELVERGHRLVADDKVLLRRGRGGHLIAQMDPVAEHHMEIRGIGIFDVRRVFGVGQVVNSMEIRLLVHLEEWQQGKDYDRTGLEEQYVSLLGIRIPCLVIPVRPGRNIAIIVEVAALNHRLKELGVNPARQFSERVSSKIRNNEN